VASSSCNIAGTVTDSHWQRLHVSWSCGSAWSKISSRCLPGASDFDISTASQPTQCQLPCPPPQNKVRAQPPSDAPPALLGGSSAGSLSLG
jgi:hypothetical protein